MADMGIQGFRNYEICWVGDKCLDDMDMFEQSVRICGRV